MSLTIETSEGPLKISDEQIQAVVRHAQYLADLTGAVLDASGLFSTKPSRLPAGFLLEFSAVLELGLWEREGLREYFDDDLPMYQDAATELAARACKGPAEFEGPERTPLSRQLFRLWLERFAWEADATLQANILLGDVAGDQFATVLADFIWKNRHELQNLLRLSDVDS